MISKRITAIAALATALTTVALSAAPAQADVPLRTSVIASRTHAALAATKADAKSGLRKAYDYLGERYLGSEVGYTKLVGYAHEHPRAFEREVTAKLTKSGSYRGVVKFTIAEDRKVCPAASTCYRDFRFEVSAHNFAAHVIYITAWHLPEYPSSVVQKIAY